MALCVVAASWSAFAANGANPTTETSIAQESRKITGKVIDAETKETLLGVRIQVKGTSQGTITDNDGNYTIEVKSSSQTLVFSFIGYAA